MNKEMKIYAKKEEIVEAVNNFDTVIITSEPGTGKTTQIPQYLYDAGYRVIIVEPRMLGAYSGYKRILEERKIPENNSEVACISKKTNKNALNAGILFCVDGLDIVSKMSDEELSKIVLIIDEAHEYKLPQEILMGWANTYRSLGHKLKLVFMSATIDTEELEEYYKEYSSVKTIAIKGKQFPITSSVVYARFLYQYDGIDIAVDKAKDEGKSSLLFCTGKAEIRDVIERIKYQVDESKIDVVALHGGMTFQEQQEVFKRTNRPKIICATNIAQSEITPPVQVVIDNGREKQLKNINGVDTLVEVYISKADCKQREGRAARTEAGEYYLITRSPQEEQRRPEYSIPEIQRLSLDKTVMKLFELNLNPLDMKFFHQPSNKAIQDSITLLEKLDAVENNHLTDIGKKMINMPVNARILVEADKRKCLSDAIKAVAIMEAGSLLNYRECKALPRDYNYFTNRAEKSDALAEIDIYDKICRREFPDLKKEGIDKKNFFNAKNNVSNIKNALKNQGYDVETSIHDNDEELIICLFKGMEDMIMSIMYDGSLSDGLYSYKPSYVSAIWFPWNFGKFCIGIKRIIKGNYNDETRLCLFQTIISNSILLKYGSSDKITYKEYYENYDIVSKTITVEHKTLYDEYCIYCEIRNYSVNDPGYADMYEKYKHYIQDEINRDYMLKNEYMFHGVSTTDNPKHYASIESSQSPDPNSDMAKLLENAGFHVGS